VSGRTKSALRGRPLHYAGRASLDADASSCPGSPTLAVTGAAGSAPQQPACSTSVLILIFHAGSALGENWPQSTAFGFSLVAVFISARILTF